MEPSLDMKQKYFEIPQLRKIFMQKKEAQE